VRNSPTTRPPTFDKTDGQHADNATDDDAE
jgi:hypothetical protein